MGRTPELVAEKLAVVRERAAARGRILQYGIRLHVIVRETEEEAWAAADRLIAHLDDDTIARAQKIFARMDSAGGARMSALHQDRAIICALRPICGPASDWCAAARVPRW